MTIIEFIRQVIMMVINNIDVEKEMVSINSIMESLFMEFEDTILNG